MEMGIIGLGRMGMSMARRLMRAGHRCVVHDIQPQAVQTLVSEGAVGAASLEDLAKKLAKPRAIWMMLPAVVVEPTLRKLILLVESDDVLIDGGNSHYHDDIRRAGELKSRNIHYVDVGTSGGVWGADRGYCLMIGGEESAVRRLDPVFAALAPGIDVAPRTPGRDKAIATAERGYLHCGPSGAGHFVKMVHNGIEYGIMAAYAEGLNILRHANVGKERRASDAETAPLRHPEHYAFDLNLADIAEVWRRGSVISSWLLDLAAIALLKSPGLADFSGRVSDSGEGRWTISAAIDESGMRRKLRTQREQPDECRTLRCPRALRRDGRPRSQNDLSGALRVGEARCSERSSHRSRSTGLGPNAVAQSGERQHPESGGN
jgi:6-phosphogluconate dehydrogenase